MPKAFDFLPDTPTTRIGIFDFPTGWVDHPEEVARVVSALPDPEFAEAAPDLAGTGAGKTFLLFLAVRKQHGSDIILHQTVGDCTSNGAALAVDVVRCVQGESVTKLTSTEEIYAGGRVEIARGAFGSGDGATGAAVAQCCKQLGTLVRDIYGSIDLRVYSGARARAWGMPHAGIPDELEPIAKQHPVKAITRVSTYAEARDAIANGYPVTVASNQGFNTIRDSQGFLKPSGSWAHQMCFIAADDTDRPGLLCMNSWGPDRSSGGWVTGARRLDQPEGSFWVDADVAERRMLAAGDSFAYSHAVGWARQDLDFDFLVSS